MGHVHHGSATTTAAVRRAIQHSQAETSRPHCGGCAHPQQILEVFGSPAGPLFGVFTLRAGPEDQPRTQQHQPRRPG